MLLTAAAFCSLPALASSPQEPQKQLTEEVPDSLQIPTYDDLDEVVISAKKPIVQANGEKTSYNLDEDASSKSNSMLEMLRKVPGVTVDGEDNIRLNGQSNFKIYVNGKEDPMLSSNASKVLKAMPATAFSKIEVINEPGAKYDAEGTGGILNFVTSQKQVTDGYLGSLTAGINTNGVNGSGFFRTKFRNVTANAHAEVFDSHINPQKQTRHSTTRYLLDSRNNRLLSESMMKTPFTYGGGGLDLSWEPDTLNLFTLNFNIMDMGGKTKDSYEYARMFDSEGLPVWMRRQDYGLSMSNLGVTAGASFQHTFREKGHHLILSYLYNFSSNEMKIDRNVTESDGFSGLIPFQHSETENLTHEHTVQADYANPFHSDKHLLEAGAKAVFRRNNADGTEKVGDTPDNLVELPSNYVRMKQFQDIAALYASYTGTYDKFGLKAGLRYEHTRMGINFRESDESDFTKRLDDIVPNAALSYSFSPAHSLRLAYQMRISRPTISQVNPFTISVSETMSSKGNPELESEKRNAVLLTYTNFGRLLGGNVSVGYSQINNMIAEYSYLEGNNIITTNANMGRNRTISLEGFLNFNFSNRMSANISGNIYYVDLNAPNPLFGQLEGAAARLKKSGWKGGFNASWNYMMPGNVRLNAYGGASWHEFELQSVFHGWYYYGISASRNFFKNDAMTLTLSLSNFCQRNRKFISEQQTGTMRSYSTNEMRSWDLGFSISWNFGNIKAQVKKTQAQIINDDATSTGNKNGGGGIGL